MTYIVLFVHSLRVYPMTRQYRYVGYIIFIVRVYALLVNRLYQCRD